MKLNPLNIFKFIESKEGRPIPFTVKISMNLPLTSEELDVKGDLDLYKVGDNITSLPNNLKVGGNIDLYGSGITSVPDNLQVGGDIELSVTPLSRKYNVDQIRKMIEDKGGYVKGEIVSY